MSFCGTENVMAKQVRLSRTDAKIRDAAPRAARRVPAAAPIADAVDGPGRSDPMRLAAEVARLEIELAAMRERIAELEAHAQSDPLTGVMNRRGFERELKRAGAYVQRYGGNAALVYLDLDDFKPVNDRFGHAAGDAVLKAVAAALLGAVRASDTVARIGGDEFAALLWNLSPQAAQAKATALERAIAAACVDWAGIRLSVGASAGVAELSVNQDIADLVARADAAMYARKRKPRAG
jgi:diguanylate cyclase (GGDEF)-like protein